jgi:hypothetical protein
LSQLTDEHQPSRQLTNILLLFLPS